MKIIGIDPGLKGGIAALHYKDQELFLCEVFKMPTKKSHGKGDELNYKAAYDLISGADMCYIEKSQAMPGNGTASMFKYGGQYFSLLCILEILSIPYVPINVRKWKNKMLEGMDKSDKKASIAKALSLFPTLSDKINDGQAEAVLIAAYGKSLNLR